MIIYKSASGQPIIDFPEGRQVFYKSAKISLDTDGTIRITSHKPAVVIAGTSVRNEAGDLVGTAAEAFSYLETVFA